MMGFRLPSAVENSVVCGNEMGNLGDLTLKLGLVFRKDLSGPLQCHLVSSMDLGVGESRPVRSTEPRTLSRDFRSQRNCPIRERSIRCGSTVFHG